MTQPAKLALEDGAVFTGESFGAVGQADGEVCFNTSMTGYQEILTDPSYRGQIVTMTYPEIGNYGANLEDVENERPYLAGFVVRESSRIASNYRAHHQLHQFLQTHGVIGLSGIDTRSLVRRIRTQGAMKGVISSVDLDDASLIQKARNSPGLVGRDLVREVMPSEAKSWDQTLDVWSHEFVDAGEHTGKSPQCDQKRQYQVVALDFGMKWNIARHLVDKSCLVTILPGSATAEEIIAHNPDGVFLSNGPGDPEPLTYAIGTIQHLLGKYPVFGICLGHQLFALACGAKTFKLKFGHRGANQPVLDVRSKRVEITSQNHGFAVSEDDLPPELEITHRNLNDDTIAGLAHRSLPAFSVQYHPEASAGPHDSNYLFRRFLGLMDEWKEKVD